MSAVCVYYQSFHYHTLLTNAILKQDFIEYLNNVLRSYSIIFVCKIQRLNIILNNKDTMGPQQNRFAPHIKLSTVQLQTLTTKRNLKMMTIDYYFYQSSVDRIFDN